MPKSFWTKRDERSVRMNRRQETDGVTSTLRVRSSHSEIRFCGMSRNIPDTLDPSLASNTKKLRRVSSVGSHNSKRNGQQWLPVLVSFGSRNNAYRPDCRLRNSNQPDGECVGACRRQSYPGPGSNRRILTVENVIARMRHRRARYNGPLGIVVPNLLAIYAHTDISY